eukprot:765453-Hanusia_phi.AAC.4
MSMQGILGRAGRARSLCFKLCTMAGCSDIARKMVSKSHLTSPHLTSPHLTSSHLISSHLFCINRSIHCRK